MTGKRNPLTSTQSQLFKTTAEDADEPIRRLVGLCLLHTGLRTGEIVHMRPGWLIADNEGMIIEIPPEEECIGGVGPIGPGNKGRKNLNDRGEPCTKCRHSPNREDNRWKVKTPAAIRTVNIDSAQQSLVDLLDWWQQGFDCLPLSHRGVNYHVRQIAEEAGLDRKVTAQNLRHTHGKMLGQKGMTATHIMARLGYSSLGPAQQFVSDPK